MIRKTLTFITIIVFSQFSLASWDQNCTGSIDRLDKIFQEGITKDAKRIPEILYQYEEGSDFGEEYTAYLDVLIKQGAVTSLMVELKDESLTCEQADSKIKALDVEFKSYAKAVSIFVGFVDA